MPDLHLSRDQLTAWRDEGAGDRGRIVTHLAACAACREVAADVERNRPPESGPLRFDAGDFAARGYRAGEVTAAPRVTRRWIWVAAAASLMAVALVPAWLERFDDGPEATRGGGPAITPVQPVDVSVSVDELTFEWKGTSSDDRVRLNVVDLENPGAPLIEREVTGSHYSPTPEERRRFRAGQSVHWYIEARGSSGGGTSPAARFRVR